MRMMPIASSSSGNCIVISDGKTNILIDCGISGKAAKAGLDAIGVDPASVGAILVTHEHSDHTKGVGIFSRKYKVPVYANARTWSAMGYSLGPLAAEHTCFFVNGESFRIGGIEIAAFSIPHDAADPVGFNLWDEKGTKFTHATDIGHMDEQLAWYLKGSEAVILESNHDIEMLKNGPYHYLLKKRILSDRGHLSNVSAACLAYELAATGTKRITLAHLSCENNTPEVARRTTTEYLEQNGVRVGEDIELVVAPKLIG